MHVLLCLAWLQVAPSATNQICWTHPWVPETSILYYTWNYLKLCSIYCSVTLRYDVLSPVWWFPTYQRTTMPSKYGKQLTVTNFTSQNTWNLLTYSSLPLLLFSVLSSSLYGLPLFFSSLCSCPIHAPVSDLNIQGRFHLEQPIGTRPTFSLPCPLHLTNPTGQCHTLWIPRSTHAFPYEKTTL